jgi:hypothetical protein
MKQGPASSDRSGAFFLPKNQDLKKPIYLHIVKFDLIIIDHPKIAMMPFLNGLLTALPVCFHCILGNEKYQGRVNAAQVWEHRSWDLIRRRRERRSMADVR